MRVLSLSFAILALLAGLALADPAVSVRVVDGVALLQLEGSYPSWAYNAYRAAAPTASYAAVLAERALCTGDCVVADLDAEPGRTYFYRFELVSPGGASASYGPYAVTIPPGATRPSLSAWPNPARGPQRVELGLPGRPQDARVDVDATLFDVAGRTVRVLHRGPLARGTTVLAWDGRDERGAAAGAGLYFLRVRTPLGEATMRLVRAR